MVLGVVRPEESPDRNGGGPRDDLGPSQMQVDGPVVLNQSAELVSDDSMAVDDAPVQQPSGQPVEATQQSPATLIDTIMEVQKQLKRKRASNSPVIDAADKDALVAGCRQELEGLFQYYKEVSDRKMQLDGGNLSFNGMVGCLLEESSLGLTRLVDEIYQQLKGLEGVSVASVRSSVLLAGQRMMYGNSSLDADVLEDESESALWCWEVSWVVTNRVLLIIFFCNFIKKRNLLNAYADKRSAIVACESTQHSEYTEICQKENP